MNYDQFLEYDPQLLHKPSSEMEQVERADQSAPDSESRTFALITEKTVEFNRDQVYEGIQSGAKKVIPESFQFGFKIKTNNVAEMAQKIQPVATKVTQKVCSLEEYVSPKNMDTDSEDEDENQPLVKKPQKTKQQQISYNEIWSCRAVYYFISKDEAIQDYEQLTKNQQIDQFWLEANNYYDIVDTRGLNYFKTNDLMEVRSILLESNETATQKFIDYVRQQKEFQFTNGTLFKCFMCLWFQGVVVNSYGLHGIVKKVDINKVRFFKWKWFEVTYQPEWKFGRRFEITRLPLQTNGGVWQGPLVVREI
ncbi:Hypothetical_protein [Hexamita inflata]|uniref:Hypothetical_protein n=1 Tax=Hexamita inflata TaxID=28002 RepID=A0AA86N6G7_9EUKA|nr:Hypothetical protein HINF_LOCUS1286 [Hexamita inflata]